MSKDELAKLLAQNPELRVQDEPKRPAIFHPLMVGRTEHDQQVALFQWADANLYRYPVLQWMFAIPNGGHRHVTVARKMKAEGVKAGVLDVCLPHAAKGFHGLYIEMKVGANKPTEEQRKYIEYLRGAGYCVRLCYSAKEATKAIEEYLGEL